VPETITEEQFRQEAKAFLDANAKPRQVERGGWGEGSDKVGLLSEKTPEEEREELRAAKDWKARVSKARHFDTPRHAGVNHGVAVACLLVRLQGPV